eukprot:jgi/Mesvir1/16410/Mv18145-RA.1
MAFTRASATSRVTPLACTMDATCTREQTATTSTSAACMAVARASRKRAEATAESKSPARFEKSGAGASPSRRSWISASTAAYRSLHCEGDIDIPSKPDRALVRRVNKENHRTFQFLRALPHVLYGIVTCVIFVPDWIRAGWLRASASIAIVLYVKLAVSAFYTSVTSHVLQRLQTRSVVRDAQTDAK